LSFGVTDELRMSIASFGNIAENQEDILFIKDRERRFVQVSPAFVRQYGVEPHEIIGHTNFELWGPEFDAVMEPQENEVLETGKPLFYNKTLLHSGRTVRIHMVPLFVSDGSVGGLIAFIWDITEQEFLKSQGRRMQKLESLASLASGMSHDFNNIFAGILGYSQLGTSKKGVENETLRLFDKIGCIAERGTRLTQKLLAFAKASPLKMAPMNINDVIEDMKAILAPLVGDVISIDVDLGHDMWGVMADRSQIEQVLLNLCINSVESMTAGGTLHIRTHNASGDDIGKLSGDSVAINGIVIKITDDGEGMSAETIDKAFDPFYTTKEPGRGTGLGLSVSHGIVERHHGLLELDSTVGAGTTAKVLLPAMEVTPSTVVIEDTRHDGLRTRKKCKVLLVEDDPSITEMLDIFLRRTGFKVSCAGNGLEALEVMNTGTFDAIITDVAMPGMDGVELARRVHSSRQGPPVVFITGCSDESLEKYGLPDDALLLRKPFDLHELLGVFEDIGLPMIQGQSLADM